MQSLNSELRIALQAASEWTAAVDAVVACSQSKKLRGHCLHLVTGYRKLAVPLVAAACEQAAAALLPPEHSVSFALALADAAYLLPSIRPIVSKYVRGLPKVDKWFDTEADGNATRACKARQALLLLLCDPSLAKVWGQPAILSLIVHASPSVRWMAIQATALVFSLPNEHKSSLEAEALSEGQLLQCTLEWEQHCSIIEVCMASHRNPDKPAACTVAGAPAGCCLCG